MALTLQNLKLGGNLEFSWYSCNILRYCSNRCIVRFFIPENCPAQANRSFPFNYMLKSKCSWSRHFEYANEQITYHFWLWAPESVTDRSSLFVSSSMVSNCRSLYFLGGFALSSILPNSSMSSMINLQLNI